MIRTQTAALFLDAYRELNAKKLFWITLVLSALVVCVCAMLGINEKGVTFLWMELPFPINSTIISPQMFYISVFTSFGIGVWLSWIATVLALVSTAGIFPDLISSGSIESMLSKPLSRLRLFATKYVAGLLFMGLQLAIFCTGFFLVIGLRGQSWQPGIFLGIPIVLIFFSYLFSVCVLLGLLTRSTVASLLLTMLLWLGLFGLNTTDAILVGFRATAEVNIESRQQSLDNELMIAQRTIDRMREREEPVPGEAGEPLPDGAADSLEAVNTRIARRRAALAEAEDQLPGRLLWSNRIFWVKTIFPKTSETIALLERNLVSDEELDRMTAQQPRSEELIGTMGDPMAGRRAQEILRQRSLWWVLGTSLIFEAIVLGLCLLIFTRRDF